jgi:hypothetical protein
MQPSLPAEPADRNIKAADLAVSAETAKFVETATPTAPRARCQNCLDPEIIVRTASSLSLVAAWVQCGMVGRS